MNSATIRSLVVAAIKAGDTDAGTRVYSPRDWPSFTEDYPLILVQTPFEEKVSEGRNAPQFTTTTTVRITGRLEAIDDNELTGATLAEAALEELKEQVERSVINSYELTKQIQQFKHVRSRIDVNSDGDCHIGQLVIEMDLEFFQGPEDFYDIQTTALEQINVTLKEPDGTTDPAITINFESSTDSTTTDSATESTS